MFNKFPTPPPPCLSRGGGGDRHLTQKASEIPVAEGGEENLSSGYTRTRVCVGGGGVTW